LAGLPRSARRILIHVNNTNPILDEQSAERAVLTDAGIEVACDGLEIRL
jgi:pyrroloquinoline quinone biosynthesis protein B